MKLSDKSRPFTHRIYVDFSGDDGDPRVPGASRCMVIAWALSAENDIFHNKGILLQIKKVIGCRPNAELKYKSLKRHPRKREALQLLSQLKLKVVVAPVLKEQVAEEDLRNPKTKRLVNLIHYFPLSRVVDYFSREYPDVYFQLVFDEIGWAGCQDEIKESFRKDERLDWGGARPDWLLFAKSGASLMLQLTDVLAGLAREYIEGSLNERHPPCRVCWLKRVRDCSFKRNKRTVGKGSLMRLLYPLLLKNDEGKAFEIGFLARPPGAEKDYLFIDCLFGGK